MRDSYARRVKRGVKLLDAKSPGWRTKINLVDLHMSSCTKCILGQVYGYYYGALKSLFGNNYYDCEEDEFKHGFNVPGFYDTVAYSKRMAKLGAAWRQELLAPK